MKKINKGLFISVIILSLFGLLMVYSSSSVWAEYKFDDPFKYLKNQGFSKKDYFEVTGYNDEKVKEELMVEANKAVKKSMIYSILAKDLNIKLTEEDFNRQYQRFGKLYGVDPQVAFQMIKKEQLEPAIINELVIDKLITTLNPSIKISNLFSTIFLITSLLISLK